MRGTTESKWGQETDPQGRDLQALDRPDELYAAGDYPKPSEAGQDACALAQLRVAVLRFLRWQPGVGLNIAGNIGLLQAVYLNLPSSSPHQIYRGF